MVFATVTCLPKKARCPEFSIPAIPGHEVAGIIDELGTGVSAWKKGQRVGVGWHGGHDGTCLRVGAAIFVTAVNQKIAGHQL